MYMLTKLTNFLSTKHQATLRLLVIVSIGFLIQLARLYFDMLVYPKYIIISVCVICITSLMCFFVILFASELYFN